jgi:small subunit ribosomal protein S4
LKGARCFSAKCPIERKGAVPPGEHGKKRRRTSDYGKQLREKQKVKIIYGVAEAQFKNYYKKAAKVKKQSGLKLLQLLEMRLDNVLFRGGLFFSRSLARQAITHGYCLVDGKKVNIASYQVEPGQVITLNEKGMKLGSVKEALKEKIKPAKWIERKAIVLKVKKLPDRDDIEAVIDEKLIIEFYSR